MAAIVAIGNPVYDAITTPYVTTGGRVLSGGSTNGGLALARLGHDVALVGNVGQDYAQRLHQDAQRYGIVPYLGASDQTGGFRLIYDQRGDRTLDVLGVAAPITGLPPACATADAITLAPILQEITLDLILHLRMLTHAPLFLDPQGLLRRIGSGGRIEHDRNPQLEQIGPLCTVIKANELETHVITGIDPRENGRQAVQCLKQLGCTIAIVTLAEAGSLIYDGEHLHRIPAFATVARDPTGAGDTYMAGFIDAYLRDPHDLFGAGCVGSATASIWIEYTGPDAPITRDEVERRTQTLREGQRKDADGAVAGSFPPKL